MPKFGDAASRNSTNPTPRSQRRELVQNRYVVDRTRIRPHEDFLASGRRFPKADMLGAKRPNALGAPGYRSWYREAVRMARGDILARIDHGEIKNWSVHGYLCWFRIETAAERGLLRSYRDGGKPGAGVELRADPFGTIRRTQKTDSSTGSSGSRRFGMSKVIGFLPADFSGLQIHD